MHTCVVNNKNGQKYPQIGLKLTEISHAYTEGPNRPFKCKNGDLRLLGIGKNAISIRDWRAPSCAAWKTE